MSSLSSVRRSASTRENDRVSLCIFTYADGRRCRTPRTASHPHFCPYHAQKESRAAIADKLAKDLASFFSGHYISANDLSIALARLLPAVVRGDIKPRTARTVAYMAQTLLQSIHFSQSEFKDSFGEDNWRKSIRSGITSNHDRLFPPEPAPAPTPADEQPEPPQPQPHTGPTPPQAQPPTPREAQAPTRPSIRPTAPPPIPAPTPAPTPVAMPASTPVLPTASTPAAPPFSPTTQPANCSPQPAAQPPRPNNPLPANPQPSHSTPNRDPYALHFDHTHTFHDPCNPFKISSSKPPRM